MQQRRKAATAVDTEAVAQSVRLELERDGVVKLSRIKPAQVRTTLAEALQREGFEVTKSVVRRPLLAQLRDALAHGALVEVKSLPSHVRGAAAPELKRLIDDAAREGVARRVLRGSAVVLCGEAVPVISRAEAEALKGHLLRLSKALEKVAKTPGLSLLLSDAATALADAKVALAGHAPTARQPDDDSLGALLAAVDSTRDVRTGLSFVPAVVGRLAARLQTTDVLKLLLSAAERELLELRPEGGMGRLSEAELSACPQGPHGTRLSWARRLTGAAP